MKYELSINKSSPLGLNDCVIIFDGIKKFWYNLMKSETFTGKTHNHCLTIYKPKSDKDIMRVRTAFLEQAEALNIMADLIGTLAPLLKGNIIAVLEGEEIRNDDIVGIGCCKACAEMFISKLEDSLAITRDLRKMLDDAKQDELKVIGE